MKTTTNDALTLDVISRYVRCYVTIGNYVTLGNNQEFSLYIFKTTTFHAKVFRDTKHLAARCRLAIHIWPYDYWSSTIVCGFPVKSLDESICMAACSSCAASFMLCCVTRQFGWKKNLSLFQFAAKPDFEPWLLRWLAAFLILCCACAKFAERQLCCATALLKNSQGALGIILLAEC